MTSALIGASRPEQVIENIGALKNLGFTSEELAEIDQFAQEGGINLWEKPSSAGDNPACAGSMRRTKPLPHLIFGMATRTSIPRIVARCITRRCGR